MSEAQSPGVAQPAPIACEPASPPSSSPFGRPLFTFLVLAAPALYLAFLIFQHGTDTPWGDQWDGTAPLFLKMKADTLQFSDFYRFHNEHRIVFPRLLTVGLAKLTNWNVRAELLVIWLLACLCAFNVWRLAKVTRLLEARSGYWLLLAANALLFTPIQWENVLWGFQIGFFLPLACITASLWIGASLKAPWSFVMTALLCFVTTFSIASGFCAWLITAPLLWFSVQEASRRKQAVMWALWTGLAVASVSLYFRGLTRPRGHPSPMEALEQPVLALRFWCAYLGLPFGTGTALESASVATFAGAALVALFAASLLYLWRCRRDQVLLRRALPWVSLASIALLNSALTTVGRVGFGIPGALQSRYISFAVFLPISLLFLGRLILSHSRQQETPRSQNAGARVVVVGTAFAVLFVLATIDSLRMWPRFEHDRRTGKSALLLINILDEPDALAQYIHWWRGELRPVANELNELGYLRPPLLRSNRIRDIAVEGAGTRMGEFNRLAKDREGKLVAIGWAILPDRDAADSVLLTYDDAAGEPIIFARADVTSPRPDVSEKLKNPRFLHTGWVASWDPGALPEGARHIRAWAFDADVARAFPIGSKSM